MKRIKAACITQTIYFINKDDCGSDYSKRKVQKEMFQILKHLNIGMVRSILVMANYLIGDTV